VERIAAVLGMNNGSAKKQRTPEEEKIVNRITAAVCAVVIGFPTIAVVGGLSVRLFHFVAGS
jgi:hypothetical protein